MALNIGFTPEQVYETFFRPGHPTVTYEEWRCTNPVDASAMQADPFHVVIQTRRNNERTLLDLTLGQLRVFPQGRDIPPTLAVPSRGWPEFQAIATNDMHLIIDYRPLQHGPEVLAKHNQRIAAFKADGLVADLRDMTALALHCDLDADRFFATLESQQPQMLKNARVVLDKYS